jgi:hypothetical protein
MDPSKTSKIVDFHKSNPLLSKVIIGSTGILRKITGKESAAKKQSIANIKERATIDAILGSNKVLNKASVSMLMNKLSSLDSDKSSQDLRKKVVEKLKSDQKKLKEQSMTMSMSVLSPSRAMMSPSAKSSTSSKKSSASSKKSSASSKKSSASSKKTSYEASEYLPVMRHKTSYI